MKADMKKTDHTTPVLSEFQERVKAFQERNSLKADAIVGPITWGVVEGFEEEAQNSDKEIEALQMDNAQLLNNLNRCEAKQGGMNPGTAGILSGAALGVGMFIGLMF